MQKGRPSPACDLKMDELTDGSGKEAKSNRHAQVSDKG